MWRTALVYAVLVAVPCLAVAALLRLGSGLPAATGILPPLSLGALMNTRGLMELVILNVGLDVGVLSPPLFAMMVVMAFVTTALTTPLLDWLAPAPGRARS